MKKLFITTVFFIATQSQAFTHATCVIAAGARNRPEVYRALTSRGYKPLLAEVAKNGELDLNGRSRCRIEHGVLTWQVCYGLARVSAVESDTKIFVADANDKVEWTLELTNKYPVTEALVGAIEKLPICEVAK